MRLEMFKVFKALLRKEILEQVRTHKLLISLGVLFVTGLISPLLAKYTPIILSSIPDIPPGLAELIPEPTIQDAVAQYIKNITQFGVLLVILLNMGAISQEKERGTLAMLYTKPIKPGWIVLAKWFSSLTVLFIGLLAATIGFWIYTTLLFEPLSSGNLLILNGLIGIFLLVYLTLTILGSALARSQMVAATLGFGFLGVFLIMGALPVIGEQMPGALIEWGSSIMLGGTYKAWTALAITSGVIIFALILACVTLEKQEL